MLGQCEHSAPSASVRHRGGRHGNGGHSLTPTEQRAVHLETWVLGRRANELHPAILDVWQEQILLRSGESMDFVDHQDRLASSSASTHCVRCYTLTGREVRHTAQLASNHSWPARIPVSHRPRPSYAISPVLSHVAPAPSTSMKHDKAHLVADSSLKSALAVLAINRASVL